MTTDLEFRSAPAPQVRGDRLEGHAIIFDVESADLGGFTEIIRSTAVDRTLRAPDDVVALWSHDPAEVLGRVGAGTLTIAKDTRGLAYSIVPPASARGRVESVERGDVRGVSFGFRVPPGGDTWERRDGGMLRTITDLHLIEISPTAFPAYRQTDVSVAQRALRALQQPTATGRSIRWLRMRAAL